MPGKGRRDRPRHSGYDDARHGRQGDVRHPERNTPGYQGYPLQRLQSRRATGKDAGAGVQWFYPKTVQYRLLVTENPGRS